MTLRKSPRNSHATKHPRMVQSLIFMTTQLRCPLPHIKWRNLLLNNIVG